MGHEVAILDIGSSRITVLIGERGVNNTISILGRGECLYSGFKDGEFYEPNKLVHVFGHALANAETNSGTKIKHLTIGVPAEFTATECRDVELTLAKKPRRITDLDIELLYDHGNCFEGHQQYDVINIQPIYYLVDDDRKHSHPVGTMSSKLGGNISYTLCERSFMQLMQKCMDDLGIPSFEFCSSLLAEVLFLFEENKRDQTVVLIDVGYLTTSVAIARGDGLLYQFSSSVGGGHISGDLATYLEVPFELTDNLLRKVVLSLDAADSDVYEVGATKDQMVAYKADVVNQIISARVQSIAMTIQKGLNSYEFPPYTPYYLTGGGLCYLRGARDLVGKTLGKAVEIIAPTFPQFNRPHLSSSLGLLNMILNQQSPEPKKGLWAKLLGK